MQITLELIKIIIALGGTGLATYFDIFNKKNIPDLLVYSFLAISIILGIISHAEMYMNIVFGIIVFAITYLFYRMGHLGGADVYILASLAILLSPAPSFIEVGMNTPIMSSIILFISLVILSGIFFAAYAVIKYCIPAIKKVKKFKKKRFVTSIILIIALIIFLYVVSGIGMFTIWYYLLFIYLLGMALIFMYLKEEIKENMIEKISLNKIDNEDVIATEKLKEDYIKKYKIPRIIKNKDIERLKKENVKKLPVYTQMPPFLPFIFIGTILALLIGDIFSYLIQPIII